MKMDLKRFDSPDEIRRFEKGYFEIVQLGGLTLGRATYEPGWKWSEHVGLDMNETSCHVEHVGLVISGEIAVAMDDGEEVIMKAGDVFHVPPGHDSWVVGDQPYVSLHFLGADVFYADEG